MFKLGDRVRLNAEGRRRVYWKKVRARLGTVVRFDYIDLVIVLWDGRDSIDEWFEWCLEEVGGDEKEVGERS